MKNLDHIKALALDLESSRVERTQSLSDTAKFCEAICAFANDMPGSAQPGYLLVGVDNKGIPTGATIDDRLLTVLTGIHTSGQILPLPTLNVERVTIDGSDVAVVEVMPSDSPPVRYRGRVYVRRGPAKGIATQEEERRLAERGIDRARTWDARPCRGSSLDDLALDLFTLSYLPQAVDREAIAANQRSAREQLAGLRLYDLRNDVPTNGCVLLFGKDPLSFFPGAYVQYVRYLGTDQASEVAEERRITGDLGQVMRELKGFAESLSIPRPVRLPDHSDQTVFEYPPRALVEIFMNAVIHRNYEGSTTPTSIGHFSDRLEVQNPGGLYGDLSREQFPLGVSYRNPVLAEAAKSLGYVNRFGRGIALTKDELHRNGSPNPDFTIGDNHFLAILRRRP